MSSFRYSRSGGNVGMEKNTTKLIDVILDSDTDSFEAIFYRKKPINFTYPFTDARRQQLLNIIAARVEGKDLIKSLIEQGVINNFKNKDEIVVRTRDGFQPLPLKDMAKNEKNEITCCVGNCELSINYDDFIKFIKEATFPDDDWKKMKIISESFDQNVYDEYKWLDWITNDTKEYIDCRITQVAFNKKVAFNKNDSTEIGPVFENAKYYVAFADVSVLPDLQSSVIKNWREIKKIEINEDIKIGENIIPKGTYEVYGEKDNTIGFRNWSDTHITQYLACRLWIMWYNYKVVQHNNEIGFDVIQSNESQNWKYGFKNNGLCAYFTRPKESKDMENLRKKICEVLRKERGTIACQQRPIGIAEVINRTDNTIRYDIYVDRKQIRTGRVCYSFEIGSENTEEWLQKKICCDKGLFLLSEPDYECRISVPVDETMIQYITDDKDRWLEKIIKLAIKKGYLYIENNTCHYVEGILEPNGFYENVLQAVIQEGTSISLDKFNDTYNRYNRINRLLHLWGNEKQKDGIENIEEYSFEDLKGCYQRMEKQEVSHLIKYSFSKVMFAWLTNNETSETNNKTSETKLEDAKKMHRIVREFMNEKDALRKELMEKYVALIKDLPEAEMYTDPVLLMRSCFEKDDFEEGSEEQKRYLQCFEITEQEN